MKYTLLARGLIRVLCKKVHHGNGKDLLKQQLELINDNEVDPLKLAEPTEEDCEAAHPEIVLVDEDSDADADIDID